MKRLAVTLMVGMVATLTAGGTALAYPPSETSTPTTEVSPEQGQSGPTTEAPEGVLPSTGSDGTMSALVVGAGLLGSGALLAGAARRRRLTA